MFLFDEMDNVGPLSNRFRVQWFKVVSPVPMMFVCKSAVPIVLGVHWLRRMILCPGAERCPLCQTHSGRVNYYLFTGTNRNVGCLEVGEQSWLKLCDRWEKEGKSLSESLLGRRFSVSRAAKNKGLTIEELPLQSGVPETASLALEVQLSSLCRLFSLPIPQLIEKQTLTAPLLRAAALQVARAAAAEFERISG
jgi:hypothetical protein